MGRTSQIGFVVASQDLLDGGIPETEPPRVWCTLPFEGRIDHDQEMEQGDKEEVIRGVLEHSHKYPSKWAAITIVAGRLGMSPESLSSCIRQYQL